jgi:hypothetical protein
MTKALGSVRNASVYSCHHYLLLGQDIHRCLVLPILSTAFNKSSGDTNSIPSHCLNLYVDQSFVRTVDRNDYPGISYRLISKILVVNHI